MSEDSTGVDSSESTSAANLKHDRQIRHARPGVANLHATDGHVAVQDAAD